ncbi:hypothetical protein [Flavobacterium lipolyticum]|uniref:Uncharacterized protein n=1 Tax=Flavobacterium lipolyticum TaxID=2893754 RepID=A0ABS8M5I1_9FLAO|nr:hypothetical protein [Flavobacterium sp. F-126]MCC9019562.1 hypothetical protein [Flavobacterium sp. F-126]
MTITSLAYSQSKVGINTQQPTQTLDVNGGLKIRAMEHVNTEALSSEYNHQVVANNDGNLGYIINTNRTWLADDIKYAILTKPIQTTEIGTARINLDLSVPIIIPPKSQAQIIINYNIPVMHSGDKPKSIGYMGCTLYKSVNGGSDVELDMGSRKYTVPGSYDQKGLAYGLPIAGFAIDIISNPGDTPMNILYKVDGYIEGSTELIRFGMFAITSQNNYNWGRGAMSVQVSSRHIN